MKFITVPPWFACIKINITLIQFFVVVCYYLLYYIQLTPNKQHNTRNLHVLHFMWLGHFTTVLLLYRKVYHHNEVTKCMSVCMYVALMRQITFPKNLT
jgi:hypothetical protein